jgi:IS30 family transposase
MSYRHLTLEERYVIHHLGVFGLSHREIGRRLGRHHTTIGREFRRNGPRHEGGVYVHEAAQALARSRQRWVRPCPRRDHAHLYRYVVARLQRDWSPEQVAGRLRLEHAADARMRVSAETIYQWVYRDSARGGDLHKSLRRGHRRRRKQGRCGTGRGLIRDRIGIAARPAVVASRSRIGDWEGDTLEGGRGKGAVASVVERKSRYTLACPLVNKSADGTARQLVKGLSRVPRRARKTLTLDNGKEFAAFKRVEHRTGIAVYFADPYAAWQRGTNENTNGLLRQYLPKGGDFRDLTEERLARVLAKLNHRPRKCLGYRSPHEVFFSEVRGALQT